jgi:hypothetical protein
LIPVTEHQIAFKKHFKSELALLLGLIFLGLVILPIAIYFVGEQFFGAYGGHGYGDFFGTISGKIRAGDIVAWFLTLSPYLAWQTVRLTARGWQLASRRGNQITP